MSASNWMNDYKTYVLLILPSLMYRSLSYLHFCSTSVFLMWCIFFLLKGNKMNEDTLSIIKKFFFMQISFFNCSCLSFFSSENNLNRATYFWKEHCYRTLFYLIYHNLEKVCPSFVITFIFQLQFFHHLQRKISCCTLICIFWYLFRFGFIQPFFVIFTFFIFEQQFLTVAFITLLSFFLFLL